MTHFLRWHESIGVDLLDVDLEVGLGLVEGVEG
jgi:hypothetical protein